MSGATAETMSTSAAARTIAPSFFSAGCFLGGKKYLPGASLTVIQRPGPPKSASQADAFCDASRERSFFFLRDLFGRATLRAAEHGSDRYLAVSIRAACELCTDADRRSRFSLAATNKLLQARKCACSTAAIRGGCSRNCLAP